MSPINWNSFKAKLSNAQQRRLSEYQAGLASDQMHRLYDKKAVKMLKEVLRPENTPFVNKVLGYLKDLKDPDGLPFARSIGTTESMMEQLSNFLKPDVPSGRWKDTNQYAESTVGKRYASKNSFQPLYYHSNDDIYRAISDWNTSAGMMRIYTGKAKKKQYLGNVLSWYSREERKAMSDGSFNQPIILAYRTQCQGAFDEDGNPTWTAKHKKRAVNIVSLPVIIAESKFGEPLTHCMDSYEYSAIGKDDTYINNWVNMMRLGHNSFLSLDYSKYDSTIPAWLIHAAFDILREISGHDQSDLLNVIERDFIYKNMITPYGVIYARHGNPSGSRLTAIINGICNELITETWMHALGYSGKYMIMGDDNLIWLDQSIDKADVKRIASYIMHNFGVKVNVDKTNYGTNHDNPEFMSRIWTPNGVRRNKADIISLIAYPERFRNYRSKNSPLTPELLLYSYCLAYPTDMQQLIQYSKLRSLLPTNLNNIIWSKQLRMELPYTIRLHMERSKEFRLKRAQNHLSLTDLLRVKPENVNRDVLSQCSS